MKLMNINEQKIVGPWTAGFALDFHTVSSELNGADEFGRPKFHTVRSEMGEALYKLKYGQDPTYVDGIVATAYQFASARCERPDVVPVPSTAQRKVAPVHLVGKKLAELLGVSFLPDAIQRTKQLPQLKDVSDFGERQQLLADAHTLNSPAQLRGKAILVFDDLFRSGATLGAVTNELLKHGGVHKVFALTLTRTRSTR